MTKTHSILRMIAMKKQFFAIAIRSDLDEVCVCFAGCETASEISENFLKMIAKFQVTLSLKEIF